MKKDSVEFSKRPIEMKLQPFNLKSKSASQFNEYNFDNIPEQVIDVVKGAYKLFSEKKHGNGILPEELADLMDIPAEKISGQMKIAHSLGYFTINPTEDPDKLRYCGIDGAADYMKKKGMVLYISDKLADRLQDALLAAENRMHFNEESSAVRAEEVAISLGQETLKVQDDLDILNNKGYLGRHQIASCPPYYTLLQKGKNKVAKIKKKRQK